jgi:predicted SprT family Zn-dependent metalloprotease
MTDPAAIRQAAEKLLAQHGLTQKGWVFRFDERLTSNGTCSYQHKEITFSVHRLNSPPAAIVNTLLHEVAHAIVGPHHHHDDEWRRVAGKIGCIVGTTCGTPGHVRPPKRWTLRCRTCGREWHRHRRAAHGTRCPRCKKLLQNIDTHADPA